LRTRSNRYMSQESQRVLARLKLRSRNLLRLQLRGFPGGLEIPFHAFVGGVRKPRVLLIAGVHGDEYESVAALHDIAMKIHPNDLRGTVTIVPVANPQAFYAGTRRNPVDLGDLNRSFPGDPGGTTSERVADLLFQSLVLGSDGVLSMHCWSREATVVPYVEYSADHTEVGRKSFAAACALGLKFLHPYTWHPGLLVAAATRHGIPSIEPEVGGMGTVTLDGQRIYRNMIYRFLQHWRLLESTIPCTDAPHPVPEIINHSDCLSNHAGLFRSCVNVGDIVEKGSLLGTVHDLTGRCIEQVRASRAGAVGILRTFASVHPGDRLVQLFWPIQRHPLKQRRRPD
jgi:predicted deacylase